jgi:serine/threonine-protein kinase
MRKNKDLEDSVKNQGTKLMNFRAFSIGFSAALLAFACGSNNNGGAADEGGGTVIEPGVVPTAPTCADNPLLAICGDPAPANGNDTPAGPNANNNNNNGPAQAPNDDPKALAQAAAENILRANCGQCHGPALTQEQARAGMNFIEDIDKLVSTPSTNGSALIKPLDSDNSLIIQRMRKGEMPPVTSTGPRPSDSDIDTVAQFIDNPNFWDVAPARTCDGQTFEYDDMYQRVQTDLLSEVDAEDRIFTRYISLANRFNGGVCAEDLDVDRWGMSKLVNMLSIKAKIKEPLPINNDQTLYRIDIRDYEWDRNINVDGQNFVDGWEAIIAASPYAVPFVGDEADVVRDETGTDVAILNADALLDVASIGNLYYALINVDVNATLDDLIANDLGIDVQDNFDQQLVLRAGTTQSVISRQDRVVERHDIEVRTGAFWQSFDFDANEQNESIFDDPFGFAEGGSEAIFQLPNQLLAYVIADENRNIAEESDILFDTLQNDFVARTSVSCSGCHAQGFQPVVDEVGPFVQRNRLDFNADDFENVRDIYLPAADFARVVEDDSTLYRQALSRAGVPTDVSDPVSDVFLRFDRDVTLSVAAGDLGVTPDFLLRELNRLDPALGVLDTSTIDRDDFTDLYVASLCVLQVSSQNQPDLNVCQDALDALDQ